MTTLDDVLLALRGAVPEADDFEKQAIAAARQRLCAELSPARGRRRPSFPRRPRRLVMAGAVCAALASLIALVPSSGGGGRTSTGGGLSIGVPPASASAAL